MPSIRVAGCTARNCRCRPTSVGWSGFLCCRIALRLRPITATAKAVPALHPVRSYGLFDLLPGAIAIDDLSAIDLVPRNGDDGVGVAGLPSSDPLSAAGMAVLRRHRSGATVRA